MGIRARVRYDLFEAMKAKHDAEKATLLLILAAMTEAEKGGGTTLTEADELEVVAKKLMELGRVIDEALHLGQTERVRALELERSVYQRYVPTPMDHAELTVSPPVPQLHRR